MPLDRLRTPPEERLAAPVQIVDLAATAVNLRAENHPPVAGHRQIAVYRNGPVTLLSFVFDAGGVMKEHRAEGVVTIHVLAGHLEITVTDQCYQLTAGCLLALAPNVSHTVLAVTGSEMLLTVHRTPS